MSDENSRLTKEEFLQFEDWKMAKDRIKHFDDVVIKIRVQGLPIATAFQIAAFVSIATLGKIEVTLVGYVFPVFSLIILAGTVYLIPIILLDFFHFRMLWLAVSHARSIEESGIFKNNLQITHKLTSIWLTILHAAGAYLIYGAVFVFGICFALYGEAFIASIKPPVD